MYTVYCSTGKPAHEGDVSGMCLRCRLQHCWPHRNKFNVQWWSTASKPHQRRRSRNKGALTNSTHTWPTDLLVSSLCNNLRTLNATVESAQDTTCGTTYGTAWTKCCCCFLWPTMCRHRLQPLEATTLANNTSLLLQIIGHLAIIGDLNEYRRFEDNIVLNVESFPVSVLYKSTCTRVTKYTTKLVHLVGINIWKAKF